MLAALVLAVFAAAPASADYEMRVRGAVVGRVHVQLAPQPTDELSFTYRSETLVTRGPVVTATRSEVRARLGSDLTVREMDGERREGGVLVSRLRLQRGGALEVTDESGVPIERGANAAGVPSALAPALLASNDRRCVRVLDEIAGESGEACGRMVQDRVEGTLLGMRFAARLEGSLPARLEFPDQGTVFARVAQPPLLTPPPDLFGSSFRTVGQPSDSGETLVVEVATGEPFELPESASQSAAKTAAGASVQWMRATPAWDGERSRWKQLGGPLDAVARDLCQGNPRTWQAARDLAGFVHERVADKSPSPRQRSAEQVFESRRGDCVGHVELFLALARRCSIPARRALGLVASDGKFWGHSWAQVQVGDDWYDVDPTEGDAPARAPRILFAAGDDQAKAGRLFARQPHLVIQVRPAR